MPPTSNQFGALYLESVNELTYLAADRPTDAFWRAIDKAISCFDALEIIPAGAQREQSREAAADSFKAVLNLVRRFAKKGLSGDAKKHLDNAIEALEKIKTEVKKEDRVQSELKKLREIAQDYPEDGIGGKNVNKNIGEMYGLNNGDGGDVKFSKGFKPRQ